MAKLPEVQAETSLLCTLFTRLTAYSNVTLDLNLACIVTQSHSCSMQHAACNHNIIAHTTLALLQDSILVAGYPLGGDSLSITKGIVSRVRLLFQTCCTLQILAAVVCFCIACTTPAHHTWQNPAYPTTVISLCGHTASLHFFGSDHCH